MQYGTLIVEVTVAQQALPIAGAVIEVTNEEGTVNQRLVSGSDGKSPVIRVEAPDRQLSLDPNNELLPYMLHGTGDLYCSCLLAAVMAGRPIDEAVAFAGDFVHDAMIVSAQQPQFQDRGVSFEPLLGKVTALLG